MRNRCKDGGRGNKVINPEFNVKRLSAKCIKFKVKSKNKLSFNCFYYQLS